MPLDNTVLYFRQPMYIYARTQSNVTMEKRIKETKMTKTEQKLRSDPRIDDVSDERSLGDGIFLHLKGHCNSLGGHPSGHSVECCLHYVHEDTWSKCLREMRYVVPCTCKDCAS